MQWIFGRVSSDGEPFLLGFFCFFKLQIVAHSIWNLFIFWWAQTLFIDYTMRAWWNGNKCSLRLNSWRACVLCHWRIRTCRIEAREAIINLKSPLIRHLCLLLSRDTFFARILGSCYAGRLIKMCVDKREFHLNEVIDWKTDEIFFDVVRWAAETL